jgi:pimeloyl-ACP methyl ester carboxylesterase
MSKATDPTIVLVHGALTDASVWNGVSEKLQAEGFITVAPAMPLRGLHTDAEYLASFLDTIRGPIVIAGHSYGGSVISHPVIAKAGVEALIFVAAFAPDAGESAGELNGRWPGSKLGDDTAMIRPHRDGKDLYLRPECFRDVYADDLAPATIALMAAAQRPIDTAALSESFRERPTWSKLPSWAVISTRDNSLPVEAQRFMAHRAKSTATEVDASHASPLSQPGIIAEVIAAAARSVVSTN